MDNFPKRKPNRLAHYDYSSTGAYFVTICTKNNKNFFWLPKSKYTHDLTNPIVGATIGRPSNAPLSQIGIDGNLSNLSTHSFPLTVIARNEVTWQSP